MLYTSSKPTPVPFGPISLAYLVYMAWWWSRLGQCVRSLIQVTKGRANCPEVERLYLFGTEAEMSGPLWEGMDLTYT